LVGADCALITSLGPENCVGGKKERKTPRGKEKNCRKIKIAEKNPEVNSRKKPKKKPKPLKRAKRAIQG